MSPTFPHPCPQCQNRVNPEDRFCLHCGTPNWDYVPEDFHTRAYDYIVTPDGIEEARATTNGKEYEAGFIAGATRQPTDEEIEAVAETVWNKVMVPNGHRLWADTQECVMKADFIDVARTALETAQGKATEE